MDLLEEYLKSGRIKLDPAKIHPPDTVHDPCNYVRKSQMAFGQSTAEQSRGINRQCIAPSLCREMGDDPLNYPCCGPASAASALP